MDTNRKLRVIFVLGDGRKQYLMSGNNVRCVGWFHQLAFQNLVAINYRLGALEDMSVFGELQDMHTVFPDKRIIMVTGYEFEDYDSPLTEGIRNKSFGYLTVKQDMPSHASNPVS